MKLAVAVWLVDNTSLTFEQIANFCGLHEFEVQGIADGEMASNVVGQNPINSGQLTREDIAECEADPNKKLKLIRRVTDDLDTLKKNKKKTNYVPIARRSDKPNAIAFILKYYPNATDKQIKQLIGTTTTMIDSIRNRTYWNIREVVPKNPVLLNLCSQALFNKIITPNTQE